MAKRRSSGGGNKGPIWLILGAGAVGVFFLLSKAKAAVPAKPAPAAGLNINSILNSLIAPATQAVSPSAAPSNSGFVTSLPGYNPNG